MEFANGVDVRVGEQSGANADALMRTQIRETVKEHPEKELRVATQAEGQRLKVLSLFFVDRVANYAAEDGKIRRWFVEAYEELKASSKYRKLELPATELAHNGYFARTKANRRTRRGRPRRTMKRTS